MKLFKKLLAGVGFAAVAATSQAAMINVGGVNWDPDAPSDFSGITATVSQYINGSSGELTGFGKITKINETENFCPDCELTFQYGGYLPVSASALLPTAVGFGQSVNYKNGWVKVYVDNTPNAPSAALDLNASNAGDGQLWLDLVGHEVNGVTFTGFNFFPISLLGTGLWDVVGGLAQGNLDTNAAGNGAGADLGFTMSFTSFQNSSPLVSFGSGNFSGNSIPEPGSLLLLSLGLLAVASVRTRKNS